MTESPSHTAASGFLNGLDFKKLKVLYFQRSSEEQEKIISSTKRLNIKPVSGPFSPLMLLDHSETIEMLPVWLR